MSNPCHTLGISMTRWTRLEAATGSPHQHWPTGSASTRTKLSKKQNSVLYPLNIFLTYLFFLRNLPVVIVSYLSDAISDSQKLTGQRNRPRVNGTRMSGPRTPLYSLVFLSDRKAPKGFGGRHKNKRGVFIMKINAWIAMLRQMNSVLWARRPWRIRRTLLKICWKATRLKAWFENH